MNASKPRWRTADRMELFRLRRVLEEVKLSDLQSKHIPLSVTGSRTDMFESLAAKVGYRFARIGTHQGRTPTEDVRVVQQMAATLLRPLKVVITSDGRLWADNTHTSLALLRRSGHRVALRDVAHYVMKVDADCIVVYERPPTLIEPYLSISASNAMWIQLRIALGWRPSSVSYTVGELPSRSIVSHV